MTELNETGRSKLASVSKCSSFTTAFQDFEGVSRPNVLMSRATQPQAKLLRLPEASVHVAGQ